MRIRRILVALMLLLGIGAFAAQSAVASEIAPSNTYNRCGVWAHNVDFGDFNVGGICFDNTTALANWAANNSLYKVATAWDTEHAVNWSLDIFMKNPDGCSGNTFYYLPYMPAGWANEIDKVQSPNGFMNTSISCSNMWIYDDQYINGAHFANCTAVTTLTYWANRTSSLQVGPANSLCA